MVLMEKAEDPLCCCEYTNVHGDRAHLCGLLCDCSELDDTVDKFITGTKLPDQRFQAILEVIEDRLRLPWPRGAVKIQVDKVTPWILVPALFYGASYSWLSQVTVNGMVLPLVIFCKYQTCLRGYYRCNTKFFAMWSLATFFYMFYIYQYQVVGILRWPKIISPLENLALMGSVAGAIYSVYKVRTTQHELSYHDQKWKYCKICCKNVPGKDHHCVWIDACISQENMPYFLAFLACIFLSLVQAGLIFLSSVCLPLSDFGPLILIPDRWCQRWNSHFEGNLHLTWTAGIHCLLLSVPVVCLLTAKGSAYFISLFRQYLKKL